MGRASYEFPWRSLVFGSVVITVKDILTIRLFVIIILKLINKNRTKWTRCPLSRPYWDVENRELPSEDNIQRSEHLTEGYSKFVMPFVQWRSTKTIDWRMFIDGRTEKSCHVLPLQHLNSNRLTTIMIESMKLCSDFKVT